MLCAGAIQSPQLLQLSGIGPAACCASTKYRCWSMRPRWGRTCRIICRCARSCASRKGARSTTTCAIPSR
ncbi:MAG: GMC family oxidoreductase N-terminal domain-containing protein [Burkholderiaceae bacterium]